jgi:hypothetical protein
MRTALDTQSARRQFGDLTRPEAQHTMEFLIRPGQAPAQCGELTELKRDGAIDGRQIHRELQRHPLRCRLAQGRRQTDLGADEVTARTQSARCRLAFDFALDVQHHVPFGGAAYLGKQRGDRIVREQFLGREPAVKARARNHARVAREFTQCQVQLRRMTCNSHRERTGAHAVPAELHSTGDVGEFQPPLCIRHARCLQLDLPPDTRFSGCSAQRQSHVDIEVTSAVDLQSQQMGSVPFGDRGVIQIVQHAGTAALPVRNQAHHRFLELGDMGAGREYLQIAGAQAVGLNRHATIDEIRPCIDPGRDRPVLMEIELCSTNFGCGLEATLVFAERPVSGMPAHHQPPRFHCARDQCTIQPLQRPRLELVDRPEQPGAIHTPLQHCQIEIEQRPRRVRQQLDSARCDRIEAVTAELEVMCFHTPALLQPRRPDPAAEPGQIDRCPHHATQVDGCQGRVQCQ